MGDANEKIQVVRHGDPHHARCALKGHDEHEHAGGGKGKHRKQQPRPCLARCGAGVLDQLPYQKVCRHNEHGGHQLQPAEEPQIQPEHIGKVTLQDAAENTARDGSTHRPQNVAEEHLRQPDLLAFDPGAGEPVVPEALSAHGTDRFLSLPQKRDLTRSYRSYDSTFSTAGELSGAKNFLLQQSVGKS